MASKEEIQIILDAQIKNGKKTIDAVKKLEKNIKGADKSIKEAEKSTKFFSTTLGKLTGALGIAYLTNAFKNFGKSVIFTRGEMEKQEIAFEVMLGSAEKANALLNELSDKAEKSPFGIIGITDTAKQLIAFGIEAEKVSETIDNLGDIATGVNVPIARLGLVYGQVKTAGRLMAQDLNQFTQAGVPLIKELSKVLNIAEKEVKELGSEGKISFENVEQAIKNMTSEGGQFYKMMNRGNDTVLGQFDEFGDVINRTMMALGKPFESVIKNTTKKTITYFKSLQKTIEENEDAIKEWAENFMEGLLNAFDVLKAFGGYAVDFFSNKWVQAVGIALISWKTFASAVTLSLGGITRALALVGGAMAYLGNRVENSVDRAFKQVESTAGALKKVYNDLKSSLGGTLGFDVENKTTTKTSETTTKTTKNQTQKTGDDALTKEKKLKDDLLTIDKDYNRQRKQEENRALEEKIALNDEFIFDDERKIKAKQNEAENIKNLGEIEVEREREKLNLLREVKGEDDQLVLEQQTEFENTKFEAQLESDEAKNQADNLAISRKKKNDDKDLKQKKKKSLSDQLVENKNFKFASSMASEYVALTQSKNKELNRIGQAAAIAQIGMQTAKSVMTIFENTLAFFGGTGPLAWTMAVAATVPVALFGATQIAEVAKNSFAVGSPNIEQDQLANIHRGEIIVPKTFSDGLRDGDLMLGNAKSLDNQQTDEQRGGITIINNFEGANFYGVADKDEMIKEMCEAISESIADGFNQPFPKEQI